MKIKVVVIALLSSLVLGSAIAQDIEYDDMYFNKNDRAKLQALRATENTFAMNTKKSKRDKEEEMEDINPTDSYSARNINPEYTSREQSQTAQEDEEDYFVNNYAYNTQSRYNNWNNNFNNWYNNPWYSSAYWGPSINSWNTPYYGSYYDMWGSPWANPYYRSGWSSSFSYYWGSRWNYGWGMNYGYVDPFYNSWAYMGPGFGYWGGRPNVIIVNNGEGGGRKRVYGKAPSRGTAAVYSNSDSRSRYDNNNNGRASNNGRISTRDEVYYNRNWRNTGSYQQQQNSSLDSRNNTQYNRSRSWDNNSSNDNSSSWGRSSNNNNSSYTPSPSFNNNSGGATRSHGSSTGSGSNGRTRGRD